MSEKFVVTCWRPSFDGVLAPWIAITLIPEWADARLHFARSIEEADRFSAEGALVLNIGTGKFSGHPHDLYPDDCASTLLARAHGLRDDPRLGRLLEIALVSDKMPVGDVFKHIPQAAQERAKWFLMFSLPALIKTMHSAHPEDPHLVYRWASQYFDAELASQRKFFDEAKPEFEKNAIRIMAVVGRNPQPIAAIRSDNDQIKKVAQSKFGGRHALLFQIGSTGNWAIFGFRVRVDDVVAVLRHAEMRARGKVLVSDWERLKWDGNLEEVPQINYHHDGQQIFNGSLTHPDVAPTKIGFGEIWSLIQVALDADRRRDYRQTYGLR